MNKGIRYRLYMEDRGTASELCVSSWWSPHGVTIIKANGHWMGNFENTLIVEICFEDNLYRGVEPAEQIKTFCKHYNEKFEQDCILVTSEDIKLEFM